MTTENIARRCIFTPYRKGCGPSFALTIWDDVGYDSMGKIKIRYRLNMIEGGKAITVFEGDDIALGLGTASDSDDAVCAVIGFATAMLDGMSETQFAFIRAHGEALSAHVEYRFGAEYEAERKAERSAQRRAQRARKSGGSGSNGSTGGGMGVVRDDLQLCDDCMIAAVNGDFTGLDYHYGDKADARQAEIVRGLESLGAHLVPDFDSESQGGIDEFSTRPCDCCLSKLAGSRHRFAVLGPKSLDHRPRSVARHRTLQQERPMNQVNIYKNRGEWCYALFVDGEFDSSDTIGCHDSATESEARAYLNDAHVFAGGPTVIERVPDTNK